MVLSLKSVRINKELVLEKYGKRIVIVYDPRNRMYLNFIFGLGKNPVSFVYDNINSTEYELNEAIDYTSHFPQNSTIEFHFKSLIPSVPNQQKEDLMDENIYNNINVKIDNDDRNKSKRSWEILSNYINEFGEPKNGENPYIFTAKIKGESVDLHYNNLCSIANNKTVEEIIASINV